ncbi:MAG: F-type H+-transporting ATPase subunit delta [Actinomycetota bacterium]|jgi:F-type H+-transporting ATPase subunit delta|nr:F-type H+-transporting ATPase subunit delta [Actinomycetota bacterium]MDQ1664495.1 F-type H+-transporting ATPase subunit delta [Actinomycetota bacterium]
MSAAHLQGVSRGSLAAARENLDTLVRGGDVDLSALADQLFAVTVVLDREIGLRRALTDPARNGDARAELARAVFGEWLTGAALDLFVWLVRSSWSGSRDLADATEILAAEAVVGAADKAGRLDALEDELFRVGRIVAANPQLRAALSDQSAPAEARVALIEGLLDGKVSQETLRLVRQAVAEPRGRHFVDTIEIYGAAAADRRSRMVALVTAAVPLTEEQRERLAAALGRMYGHDVHLNIEIDPELIGGLRVAIGDEVIDGSVATKLDDARRRLAG